MSAPTDTARRRDPQYQHLVLTITASPSGYRLAYVGAAQFEVIEDGLTLEEASALYQAAVGMDDTV